MDLIENKSGKYLYKYLPYNQYSLELLACRKLWLGAPNLLNDPFEGDIIIGNIKELHSKEFCEFLADSLRTRISMYILDFDDTKEELFNNELQFTKILYEFVNKYINENFGCTSFSKTCNILKMWSHYADSHKGFVLIFDRSMVEATLISRNIKLVGVKYNGIPTIDLSFMNNQLSITNKNVVLVNKLRDWQDEQEVRLIKSEMINLEIDRLLRFDVECLIGIIYGNRIELNHVFTIDNILASWPKKWRNELKFFSSHKNEKRDKIEFVEIDYNKKRRPSPISTYL